MQHRFGRTGKYFKTEVYFFLTGLKLFLLAYLTYNCVCFHMTAVPYGRGGSPLQNLIIQGFSSTLITALKMVKELDAGGVYTKRTRSLRLSARYFQSSTDLL